MEVLMQYKFTVVHLKGAENVVADALSRVYVNIAKARSRVNEHDLIASCRKAAQTDYDYKHMLEEVQQ